MEAACGVLEIRYCGNAHTMLSLVQCVPTVNAAGWDCGCHNYTEGD